MKTDLSIALLNYSKQIETINIQLQSLLQQLKDNTHPIPFKKNEIIKDISRTSDYLTSAVEYLDSATENSLESNVAPDCSQHTLDTSDVIN